MEEISEPNDNKCDNFKVIFYDLMRTMMSESDKLLLLHNKNPDPNIDQEQMEPFERMRYNLERLKQLRIDSYLSTIASLDQLIHTNSNDEHIDISPKLNKWISERAHYVIKLEELGYINIPKLKID